jgi:hypothetical protein
VQFASQVEAAQKATTKTPAGARHGNVFGKTGDPPGRDAKLDIPVVL